MSDENNGALIKSLEGRINSLEAENKKLNNEAAKRRHKNQDLQAKLDAVTKERDELAAGFTELEAEHNTLKERSSSPDSAKDQKIAELEGTIRTMNHKEVFKGLAKAANVREDALDDLWDLSGYKAEADQADEAKLKELIAARLKGRDYLLSPKVETTTAAADAAQSTTTNGQHSQAITTPATKPGPGAARTTSDTSRTAAQSQHSVLDRVNRDFVSVSITGDDGRL